VMPPVARVGAERGGVDADVPRQQLGGGQVADQEDVAAQHVDRRDHERRHGERDRGQGEQIPRGSPWRRRDVLSLGALGNGTGRGHDRAMVRHRRRRGAGRGVLAV
jgi:hypothetical protein